MREPKDHTASLTALLDRLAAGDEAAAGDLIAHSMDRLRRLARKRLRADPRVRRWEATDDVLQNALVRLHRALGRVRPASERHFLNLAAAQIQRELIDLARHHFGPEGAGRRHATDPPAAKGGGATARHEAHADPATGPETALREAELHRRVDRLPEEEREVFRLLFYLGLDQAEAARRLGVSVPTVKRRWRAARLRLHDELGAG